MALFDIIAILLTLASAFSYLNSRFIHLPSSIAQMGLALFASLALLGLSEVGLGLHEVAAQLLESVHFDDTLLRGMLSFLLFAGALHVNLDDLAEHSAVIGTLATLGVVLSTVMVGLGMFLVMGWWDLNLPLGYCLLFGALVSPTDPIAVLAILKSAGVSKGIAAKIAGESLFNDGIAVVVFLLLLELTSGRQVSAGSALWLLASETCGGLLLGLAGGWIAYRMLRSVDDHHVEVLVTLALVTGSYSLALALHLSGPIAVVVAGLFIGNHGRRFAMSERTRHNLDLVWESVDEILNAVLFLLIGLEVLVIRLTGPLLFVSLCAIGIALLARWIAVALPIAVVGRFRRVLPGTTRLLVWGGLRGGISVALALSLPPGPEREVIVSITYVVVAFSILVQGLTVKRVAAAVA